MRDKVLRIMDKGGNSFRLRVSTPDLKGKGLALASDIAERLPFFRHLPDYEGVGKWSVVDEGFLKYRSGAVRPRHSSNGDLTTRDVLIIGREGIKAYDGKDLFGIQLFEYEDAIGVNQDGEGFVIQPWVIAMIPGRIKWGVID